MDKAGTTPGATGKLTQSKISDFVEQLDSGSKKKNKLREVSPIPEDDMTPSRRLRAAGKEVDSASEKDTKKIAKTFLVPATHRNIFSREGTFTDYTKP